MYPQDLNEPILFLNFWFGSPFCRTSNSSAYSHYGFPCCTLENIYNVMLVYWPSSCQFFYFILLFIYLFILGVGDVHIAVDSASPANHVHVTGQMPVN